jgi:hypothetical protein
MTDSIKVWVPVEADDCYHIHLTRASKEAAQMAAAYEYNLDWRFMEATGFWTIQPMTLTHGHKE